MTTPGTHLRATGLLVLVLASCGGEDFDSTSASASTVGSGGVSGGGAGGGGSSATASTANAGGATGCVTHEDCTDAEKGQCDNGTCVPCSTSEHCVGVPGHPVCYGGTCVECKLEEEGACVAPKSCDLVNKTCVDVAPGSVTNCKACSNDVQCLAGHRCIEMEFMGTPHGAYCLREFPPVCEQPFSAALPNRPSISGAVVNVCGVNEDLATCEAVWALWDDWRCSGVDGMCSPDGVQPEIAVPGALCRDLAGGSLDNRCTYACGGAGQCFNAIQSPGLSTCGTGTPSNPPSYCGG